MDETTINIERFVYTPTPTPPLPIRNPHHHGFLRPLPDSGSEVKLIPKPLFAKRKRPMPMPPNTLHVTVHELAVDPTTPTTPTSSNNSSSASQHSDHEPSSPTSSFRSFSSGHSALSTSSTPTAPSTAPSTPSGSPGSSPAMRPRALTYAFPPPDVAYWSHRWREPEVPKHRLRRKPSPRFETLRSLRARESEARLKRCFDEGVEAYLEGRMGGLGLGVLEEE